MTLKIVEQNTAQCVQCPYCSLKIELAVVIEDGKLVRARTDQAPEYCPRCTSPMDMDKVTEFADKRAREESGIYGPLAGIEKASDRPAKDKQVDQPTVKK